MFKDVLIATDGSKHGEQAAKVGISLAKLSDGKITVLYVVETGSYIPIGGIMMPFDGAPSQYAIEEFTALRKILLEKGEEATKHIEKLARELDVPCEKMVVEGHPACEILKIAEDSKKDIIVMGSIGKTGLERILLGSVAEKVVRNSKVPVLIIHGNES